MNKVKLLFFILAPLATLFQFNTALAENSPIVLNCPEKIECSRDKSISSCKSVGDNLEYWGEIDSAGWIIKKGTYSFQTAISYYQPTHNYEDVPLCVYSLFESGREIAEARIRIKPGVHLEALLNAPTQWRTYASRADCYNGGSPTPTPQDPKLCPFNKIPLIGITLGSNNYFSLSAYANGILITKAPIYSPMGVINMYQAWDACSDTGLCTIELMATINQALVGVGSIVVDMDNKMKIVDVYAITGFEISHDEKLNSIEIKTTL